MSTQTIEFWGANSLLDLTNWGTCSGVISEFDANGVSNDAIDVTGLWTWVGFNQSAGVMTFADGGTDNSVKLTGGYIAGDFRTQVDSGVTQVTCG